MNEGRSGEQGQSQTRINNLSNLEEFISKEIGPIPIRGKIDQLAGYFAPNSPLVNSRIELLRRNRQLETVPLTVDMVEQLNSYMTTQVDKMRKEGLGSLASRFEGKKLILKEGGVVEVTKSR